MSGKRLVETRYIQYSVCMSKKINLGVETIQTLGADTQVIDLLNVQHE